MTVELSVGIPQWHPGVLGHSFIHSFIHSVCHLFRIVVMVIILFKFKLFKFQRKIRGFQFARMYYDVKEYDTAKRLVLRVSFICNEYY